MAQGAPATRCAVRWKTKGYDSERGVFVQAFDHPVMDASLLLLPEVGLWMYSDQRMLRTTDSVRSGLAQDGLLRRYAPDDDSLQGSEGVFLACCFWLVECLARQGRVDEAHEVFRERSPPAMTLGLFAEEYDTRDRRDAGQFSPGPHPSLPHRGGRRASRIRVRRRLLAAACHGVPANMSQRFPCGPGDQHLPLLARFRLRRRGAW